MVNTAIWMPLCCLALVLGCSAFSLTDDGNNNRIAGGANATDGQFPFQVALINQGNVYCGGAVLNRRWVISSAACLTGKTPATVTGFLGSSNLLEGGQNVSFDRLIAHPNFNDVTYANDIGLLRTSQTLFFNDHLQPVTLPDHEDDVDLAAGATIAGWGRLSISNSQSPEQLQFIRVDIVGSEEECVAQFDEPYAERISERTLCTQNLPEQGVCLGDAGVPLVQNGTLVAVQSWSVPCGLGLPDVYERVSFHRAWILVHTLL